jgi:hypothetical protein
MNIKFLLPLILVSASAQADLIPDRQAVTACDKRFDQVNRSQAVYLRPGPVHVVPTRRVGPYQYYFNASRGEATYRVQCRATRSGQVLEFALDPGKWVFEDSAGAS